MCIRKTKLVLVLTGGRWAFAPICFCFSSPIRRNLMLSTHQIINVVLFLTSSFERTEFICSVIFSCFISFPTNRLSQRSPPEHIHYFRYFAIVALPMFWFITFVSLRLSHLLPMFIIFVTIVTLTSNVLDHIGGKGGGRLPGDGAECRESGILPRTCLRSLNIFVVICLLNIITPFWANDKETKIIN